jgi:glycosyltransferase involved in cell wall biosynthesis
VPHAIDDRETVAAIAWDGFQARTQTLAGLLGGRAWYMRPRRRLSVLLPLRYLVDGVRTWRLLQARRPQAVLVISPPVFAPLVAGLWARLHRRALVVDCHTGAFHGLKWRWSRPLHRLLFQSANAVLVHTEEDEELLTAWGVSGFLLPDDVPDAAKAAPLARAERPTVLVAGSFDGNEPIAVVLAAAELLPDVEFRLTGDMRRLPAWAPRRASANVVFTGWLEYEKFLGELLAAHVVGVFSTDPHIMNRSAFEAIGLGRPLVLSDLAGLRRRFGEAALLCANRPAAVADALRLALARQDELAARSAMLRPRLRAQHERALTRLKASLDPSSNSDSFAAGQTGQTA